MITGQANWLSGQDLTTPAHDRRADVHAGHYVRQPATGGRWTDALVFLAGVWLVAASAPLAYAATGRFDVFWNDAVVGIAVAVVTLTRLVRATVPASTAAITAALGAWLVAAPFVLGYGGGTADARLMWSDLLVGLTILTLSLAGLGMKPRPRPQPALEPVTPGLIVTAPEPLD
jgi:hypothetical protein